jgi:subtilisin-like proprotein convertase family protein
VINGIIHPCFNDLDIMLVAPSGQSVILMSDVGGCSGVPNATFLTFDDQATQFLSPGATPTTPSTVRVTNNGAGDPFPAPAPAPSGATRLSAFNGVEPNGAWRLYIVDDTAGGSGVVQRGWSLDLVTLTEVCDPTPLVIPDSGPASAYPSSVTLSGLPPQIAKVTVTLKGLTHDEPNDLDVMLVGPANKQVTLMSDAGGISSVSNLEITFDDDVWGFIPDETVLSSLASQPADYEGLGDPFPAPAPANISSTDLKVYRGENPNTTWRLYVVDDAAGNAGTISGGWCLRVTSIVPSESCFPFSITIPATGTEGPASIYPTNMVITGASGLVRNVEVRLLELSHTFPDDLDIVLQGPSGREFSLLSDAGFSFDVNNLDVTINDKGAPPAPDSTQLGPGPYGMTDYEAQDPLPGGPAPPYFFSTQNEPPNGNWSLWIYDDAGADVGVLAGGYCMSLTLTEPTQAFCSDAFGPLPLTIPSGAPGTTSGPATPYPWQVHVPLQGTIVRKVRVRLENLSHTFPDDLDVMLVGPQGQKTVLISDAGGSTDAVNQTITFDYQVDPPIPDSAPFVNGGVYRQQDYEAGDIWPAPAPPGTFVPDLASFQGTDAFGFWNLWVVDDAGQDVGSIGRWCLEVLPLYPPGEATNLRWFDKTQLQWDAAPNATNYTLLRGMQSDMPNLLTVDTEGCIPDDVGTNGLQMAFGLNSVPPPGMFYWYLVMARSGVAEYGPAGDARVAGVESARVADPTNLCATP